MSSGANEPVPEPLSNDEIEQHPLLKHVPPELRVPVSKRIAFSAEHGFCYFRVPKAANSTVALTLARHAGLQVPADAPEDGARFAKKAFSGLPTLEEVEQAFRFTFVRHPVSRVLSAYLDKATRKNYAKRYGFKHRFLRRRPFTFLDFLNRLEDGVLLGNVHWAPQVIIIPYDLDRLDRIGKLENLREDLAFVIDRIFSAPLEMKMREDRRTGADKKVAEYVGPKERAIIDRLYAADFERLYPEG